MKPDTYPSEIVTIDSLRPWPTNYNQHDDAQRVQLGASLKVHGQFRNIVIWQDYIVTGHGLVEAAQARGYTEIEVKRLPAEWSEAKVQAVLVADNELAKLSTPDNEQLAGLLQEIRLENDEWLETTGWDGARLDGLLRELANVGEPGNNGPDPSLINAGANVKEQFGVIVICNDEAHQEETYNQLLEEGYTVKVVTV